MNPVRDEACAGTRRELGVPVCNQQVGPTGLGAQELGIEPFAATAAIRSGCLCKFNVDPQHRKIARARHHGINDTARIDHVAVAGHVVGAKRDNDGVDGIDIVETSGQHRRAGPGGSSDAGVHHDFFPCRQRAQSRRESAEA